MAINRRLLVAATLAASCSSGALAGPARDAAPLSVVASFDVKGLDSAALLAAAEALDATGGPYQFAEAVAADLEPEKNGTWEAMADGRLLWRQVVSSEGALSLNIGFSDFHLPPGAEAYLYSADGKTVVGPLTEADNEAHGEYWSPIVPGDSVVIEVQLPADVRENLRLKIGSVNHGFRGFRRLVEKSGACNVDVVCAEGDGWRDQIRSVAVYSRGGTFACTGAAVNNTARDRRGFFLTADHCGVSTSNVASVVAYWNFENSTCRTPGGGASGGNGDGQLNQFNTGAIFRAEYQTSDMTLIEFDDPIDPAFDVYFAGWDRRDYTPAGAVAIHHPNTDEKRISFEDAALAITSYLQNTVPGNSSHLRVVDWDIGTTEPGSSGSPLFDSATKRIVGQLHGGFAACGNDDSDWYGRVFVSWAGGGANGSRLSNWLDPNGTGEEFVDGLGLAEVEIVAPVEIDDSVGGDGDGVLEPGESDVALHFVLRNLGTGEMQNVVATLSAVTAGVGVPDAAGTFANIAAGATGALTDGLAISVPASHPCGAPVQLTLAIDSATTDAELAVSLPTGPTCDVVPSLALANVAASDTIGNGNGNGRVDAGETTIRLAVTLANGGGAAAAFQGTLSSETATATVPGATASWPAIAAGGQGTSTTPFTLRVDPSHPCGSPIELALHVTGANFDATIPVEVPTGTGSLVAARTIAQAVPIADLATATAPIAFPESGFVQSVRVTLNATHTYDADLDISLIGPTGTTVVLMQDRGGSGDNLTNTVFDDAAAQPISAGAPPFTGSFRPEQPLSAFAGAPINGTWTISIFDDAANDTGTLSTASGISITYAGACEAPKTIEPTLHDATAGVDVPNGGTIDLGKAIAGTPVSHVIEIANNGTGTLGMNLAQFPAGFTLEADGDFEIGPGETLVCTLGMNASSAGTKSGTLVLATNDPDEPTITLNLVGAVICPAGDCPRGDIFVITQWTDVWYSAIESCAYAPTTRMQFVGVNHDVSEDEIGMFGDLDNDGLTDVLVLSDRKFGSPATSGGLYSSRNAGNGTLGATILNSEGWSVDKNPAVVQFAGLDWNGDGMMDLFQVTNGSIAFAINSLGNIGNPTTVAAPGLTMGAGVHVASGDIDGDGFDDLLHVDNATGAVHVLRGSATSPATQLPTLDVLLASSTLRHDPAAKHAIVVGDFNGDGSDDIAHVQEAGVGAPNVEVALASNGGGLDAPTAWAQQIGFHADPSRTLGWWVFAADVDCDGKDDLLQQTEFQTIWVALSNGTDAFGAPFPVAGLGYQHKPDGPWMIGVGNAL